MQEQPLPDAAPGHDNTGVTQGEGTKVHQRLGELLIAEKMINAEQLEDAVEAQCLYGGRLGTSLIELGYLDEEEIAKTLSRKLRLPYIEPGLLMKIPSEVIALVPQKLAWKHLVIPCRLEKKRLYLAMSDPTNLTIIDALAFRLGFIIVPVVVPEIRLMLALQKYYQLELSPRFQTLSQSLAKHKRKSRPDQSANPKTQKAQPQKQRKAEAGDEPEETILEVSTADILVDEEVGDDQWPLLGEKDSLDNLSDTEYQKLINMPEHLRLNSVEGEFLAGADRQVTREVARLKAEEQHPFTLLCVTLTAAGNRDDIANAIIEYLTPHTAGAALLMVKDNEAMGWKATADGDVIADFAQLRIPLDQPSVLQTVATSKSYYIGPLTKEANNIILSSYFGHQLPQSVLLIPLFLRDRLVTLLYLQDKQGEGMQEKLSEYQRLVIKTTMAFEMLILKNKIQMG